MPFGADVSGFLSSSADLIGGVIASPAGLVNLASIGLGWLFAKAVGSILGEYVKRVWFRRIWQDEVTRCREQVAKLQASTAIERAEYQWAIACTARLLAENEQLLLRVIRAEAQRNGIDHDDDALV